MGAYARQKDNLPSDCELTTGELMYSYSESTLH